MKKWLLFAIVFLFPLSAFASSELILLSPFFVAKPGARGDEITHKGSSYTREGVVEKVSKKQGTKKEKYLEISSKDGISLWRNRLGDVYMAKLDLSHGLKAKSLGEPTEWDERTGEPLYPKKNIQALKESTPYAIRFAVNGQFFDPKRNPTPLSFGLKDGDTVRTAGADNRDEKKNILIFGSGYAQIVPYSWEYLRDARGDIAIVGLSLGTRHQYHASLGRTYICLKNPDSSNTSSEVLVFVAVSMSEYAAERIILASGCTWGSVTKLDASGSSQMIYDSLYISGDAQRGSPDNRKIPQAIGFY